MHCRKMAQWNEWDVDFGDLRHTVLGGVPDHTHGEWEGRFDVVFGKLL